MPRMDQVLSRASEHVLDGIVPGMLLAIACVGALLVVRKSVKVQSLDKWVARREADLRSVL